MAKQFPAIEPRLRSFIENQRIFFVASAAAGTRVNVSPKEIGALRVLDERRVAYLDQTGSGNETAAHILAGGTVTIMFCAFAGPPMILRLYGRGRVLRRGGAEYAALLAARFDGVEPPGARQMVLLDVEIVQTSCGFGVPLFEPAGERPTLRRWAESKGEAGLVEYRSEKNVRSLDGLPTGLVEPEGMPAEEPVPAGAVRP
ncbi:pyridoxamine 5'-phosphate oxidase family protein [Propylenella binzhouense]|uniref:Pyridoxamine 5'-phosphate oxidase family protein n=1 Tax=Propylenella binzhouense TaxID=2555902 RepID=A0A964T6J9_9HYPH|nr:pyridoxamine 5'-phosphate oxidase family protein [Propylenella binzhouense]MYZ49350.1 pyridoxamine 5'-phosphate oxidase family protein [Propylenella binzhouense]